VGLLNKLRQRRERKRGGAVPGWLSSSSDGRSLARVCRVELMEPRCLLAGDIQVGGVYFEEATGDDSAGDTLQITFVGGPDGVQLTRLELDGDKLADGGLTLGDIFFDTTAGGDGAFKAVPLNLVSHVGFDVVGVTLVDGGTKLVMEFSGFDPGEKLVFTVDVDEQGLFSSTALAEGGEFEGTRLTADFTAPHHFGDSATATFFDNYNANLAGRGLNLPLDDYLTGLPPSTADRSDRTAGAATNLALVPLPITIAGTVFDDLDIDNQQDPGDAGIANVTLSLLVFNGTTYVATGRTATTDAQGNYKFDDLAPGTYRLAETQPAGYFSVGATAGTVSGATRGVVTSTDVLSDVTLLGGEDSIDNDFAEARPGSIRGRVHADDDGDCVLDPEEQPLEGVVIHLLNANGETIATTTTDANGEYQFTNLAPGVYGVFEAQPSSHYDGDDHVGSAGGVLAANDRITQITLGSGTAGVEYNFCEIEPASLAGHVFVDDNNNGMRDAGESGVAGVTLVLLDAAGNSLGVTTVTDAAGAYAFTSLAPGVYGVAETQPAGLYDGLDKAGSAGGTAVNPGDRITGANLAPGTYAVNYDFGELRPASIRGRVHADRDGDCVLDPDEQPLEGVVIHLLNANGQTIATTTTDANGEYQFTNLAPGTYGIVEEQPGGYYDADDHVGSAGGVLAANDRITQVTLGSGTAGVEYNFCEHEPASISGRVHLDTDGDCELDPDEQPLEGVLIQLLNADGLVVAETHTDASGLYQFASLPPGTYGVREIQPAGYLDGGDRIGSAGGVLVDNDLIAQINLGPGASAIEYNFCEIPGGTISGYVFQDGDTIQVENLETDLPSVLGNLPSMRDGLRTSDDTPLAGVRMRLTDATGIALLDSAGRPIETVTDANGFYQFTNLPPGLYSVIEVQPDGYVDGVDWAGTTGGFALNAGMGLTPLGSAGSAGTGGLAGGASISVPGVGIDPTTGPVLPDLNLFGASAADAIALIPLGAGEISVENNFSEVRVAGNPPPPVLFPPQLVIPPLPSFAAPFDREVIETVMAPPPPTELPPLFLMSAGAHGFTWHLSVVDAGRPRGPIDARATLQPVKNTIRAQDWQTESLDQAEWILSRNRQENGQPSDLRNVVFGATNAIPVTGDFNGDGVAEVGIFRDGEWFIDLNGNGVWDEDDLWAKLGTRGDQPVTGDWDGDGKDDIGIFGRAWPGDPHAIEADPGLPNPLNFNTGTPKNPPPDPEDATHGLRTMKHTERGTPREDLIDHVFHYGAGGDMPIAGDWDGTGTDSIGVFRDGTWALDVDGDGRTSAHDRVFQMGEHGDRPVVGDFNGDGIDEIGLFRDGTWRIDLDHDGQLTERDLVFQLGGAGDLPIVADFDGDGRDDAGVYQVPTATGPDITEAPEEASANNEPPARDAA